MSLVAGPVRTLHPGPFELAEGPLWHPDRQRLFWFSILDGTLHSADADGADVREWRLGERASAAGVIDRDHLLLASETGLWTLDLEAGEKRPVVPLEADNTRTRSNDGRSAPDGAFWIGTMGLAAEDGLGAFYRYDPDDRPPVAVVRRDITIPNATCFAPDGSFAYLCDTRERVIRRAPLADGRPAGEFAPHIDLRSDGLNPDGAVVDEEGCLWCAMFGAGEVQRFSPDGERIGAIAFPARQLTCPAFGGKAGRTLFVTSAWEHLHEDERPAGEGAIYAVETTVRGRADPRVRVPPISS